MKSFSDWHVSDKLCSKFIRQFTDFFHMMQQVNNKE